MTESEEPIAWSALDKGTPVYSSDGTELGKVAAVIADEQKDIFSGISLNPGLFKDERFVPADLIDRLTTDAVYLNIAESLAHTQLQKTNP
jgi:uncharacterized protein YrrD